MNVVACVKLGYALFDSAMPTRDARRGRLYVLNDDPSALIHSSARDWLSHTYIGDNKHIKAGAPIADACDCLCCRRYSLGYLHHRFKINDTLCSRLATIHNLRTMARIAEGLRWSEARPRAGSFVE